MPGNWQPVIVIKKKQRCQTRIWETTVVTNNIDWKSKRTKYSGFCPIWKKQEQIFGKAIINDMWVKNDKGDLVRSKQKQSWPYIKPIEQITYENFMTKISNPLTGKFNYERDSDRISIS